MRSAPLDLPLRTSEAAAIAELLLQCAANRPVRDDVRGRLAARLPSLQLTSIRAFPGSLANDPIHPSAYFLAVDASLSGPPHPLLLRFANASSPASGLFPNPLLIGRMRAGLGPEVVVNALSFGPEDHDQLRTFAQQIDKSFLPRPLGTRPPFSIATDFAATRLPAAFEAFRYILRNRGMNQAVIAAPHLSAESIRNTESVALWTAIRAGWRDGFALELGPIEDASTLTAAAGYTTFIAPASIESEIARVKSRQGTWKRFDPDPAIEQRTAALKLQLDDPAATAFADIILEFA